MTLRTQLVLGYLLVFLLMIGMSVLTYLEAESQSETDVWVSHTHDVIGRIHNLEKLVVDMETGMRGYLLTGKDEFLEPYNNATDVYNISIKKLQESVSDNPPQVELLEQIKSTIVDWQITVAKVYFDLRREVDNNRATLLDIQNVVSEEKGKLFIDLIREKIANFQATESKLLSSREKVAADSAERHNFVVFFGTSIAIALGILGMLLVSRSVLSKVGGEPSSIQALTERISKGDLDFEIQSTSGIQSSVVEMMRVLKLKRTETQRSDWVKTGIARLNDVMSDISELKTLGSLVISELANYLDAQVGTFYLVSEEKDNRLVLLGGYACKKDHLKEVAFGEGLVGQAAMEKKQIVVTDIPADYIKVNSSLGETQPKCILVSPFIYEDKVAGVIELATLEELPDYQREYIKQAMNILAIVTENTKSRAALATSLAHSQQMTEELQTQQEELRAANEELEEQSQALRQSEEELKAQSEELQQSNEELEEKSQSLEEQKRAIENANESLERSRAEIEEKAEKLALSSKYKSEFLANMSHELRTPLNSLLILSKSLSDNRKGNLTDDQVESATVILSAGKDLLTLINDILDLAKIEAGKTELDIDTVKIDEIMLGLSGIFKPVADSKKVELNFETADDVPESLRSDGKRIHQILKNLLSNAFKFTSKGSVRVRFHRPENTAQFMQSTPGLESGIAISVTDTGTGIAKDKQLRIFEAFEQEDGSISRKFGGTGLGLAISRELARVLGGEINLQSVVDEGSTFTLILPLDAHSLPEKTTSGKDSLSDIKPQNRQISEPVDSDKDTVSPGEELGNISEHLVDEEFLADDRKQISKGDKTLLIIEDDQSFAKILMQLANARDFKCLCAGNGRSGVAIAEKYSPTAIILDLGLPDVDGLAVLEHLKNTLRTRHIPVHVISARDARVASLKRGALDFISKPASAETVNEALSKIDQSGDGRDKKLLVIEDDDVNRKSIIKLIDDGQIQIAEAAKGSEAIDAIKQENFDCIILDLNLPDMTGFELLQQLEDGEFGTLPPVIIHTGRELTKEEHTKLNKYSSSIIIKGVASPERLLDQTSLFLHSVTESMPNEQKKIIQMMHVPEKALDGKFILLVDDDLRNTFALSRELEEYGMHVILADNGELALEKLEEQPDVDLVLMDIMMPVMDGYEATRRIRKQTRFKGLPIIALSALAMPEDKNKCLECGADDYLSKPVDVDKLLSVMRIWLFDNNR